MTFIEDDKIVNCSILTQEVRYISTVSIETVAGIRSLHAQCTRVKG